MANDPDWLKSSFSDGTGDGNNCVQMASMPDGRVAMRNSMLGDESPVVYYTQNEIRAFLLGAKAGEFDKLGGL